jgi:hypothetical protein
MLVWINKTDLKPSTGFEDTTFRRWAQFLCAVCKKRTWQLLNYEFVYVDWNQ